VFYLDDRPLMTLHNPGRRTLTDHAKKIDDDESCPARTTDGGCHDRWALLMVLELGDQLTIVGVLVTVTGLRLPYFDLDLAWGR
jgi:hypothetical protein